MKDKITVIVFFVFILTFGILHIAYKDEEISSSERRKLANFPKLELNNEYVSKLDKYLLDHFPYREGFRSIKASFNYDVLNKYENNNIYLKENYIFKSEHPTNIASIDKFNKHIQKITSMLTEENNVYLMVIPDKNYYLEDDNFLHIDYDYLYSKVYMENLDINKIDIRNIMELSDYYETDTHWKQENLEKVLKQMDRTMNFNYIESYYTKTNFEDFYGTYYGEAAINREPENLTYMTNSVLDNVKVKYLENTNLNSLYNVDKLQGLDAYEVYLDGATAFVEIYNENSKVEKELIVFRDSFGSSIVPLLSEYYSKITVIDNRYITSNMFKELVEFKEQDVLFLYSTLIVNNSGSIKN